MLFKWRCVHIIAAIVLYDALLPRIGSYEMLFYLGKYLVSGIPHPTLQVLVQSNIVKN